MRGSSGAPDSPATRSDSKPAQVSTRVAVNSLWLVWTVIDSVRTVRPVTGCPIRMTPPS